MPKTAPYGSWKSPITSDLIVAQSIALSEARLDGEKIYWLEGRPQEQGRFVVVCADWSGGNATDVTPKPYSARTRVHEYGGASWTVADGVVYFSNFADGRLYYRHEKGTMTLLEPNPKEYVERGRFEQPDRTRSNAATPASRSTSMPSNSPWWSSGSVTCSGCTITASRRRASSGILRVASCWS